MTTLRDIEEQLQGDVGVKFSLESPMPEAERVHGLQSSAVSFLNDAVRCVVVDMDQEAVALSALAEQFLARATDLSEVQENQYWPGLTEAQRIVYYALSGALARPECELPLCAEAIPHLKRAKPSDLEGYHLLFMVTGDREHLLSQPGLRPASPGRISSPDKFAYYLAAEVKAGSRESPAAVHTFLRRFGRRCLRITKGLGTPIDLAVAAAATRRALGETVRGDTIASLVRTSIHDD